MFAVSKHFVCRNVFSFYFFFVSNCLHYFFFFIFSSLFSFVRLVYSMLFIQVENGYMRANDFIMCLVASSNTIQETFDLNWTKQGFRLCSVEIYLWNEILFIHEFDLLWIWKDILCYNCIGFASMFVGSPFSIEFPCWFIADSMKLKCGVNKSFDKLLLFACAVCCIQLIWIFITHACCSWSDFVELKQVVVLAQAHHLIWCILNIATLCV